MSGHVSGIDAVERYLGCLVGDNGGGGNGEMPLDSVIILKALADMTNLLQSVQTATTALRVTHRSPWSGWATSCPQIEQ